MLLTITNKTEPVDDLGYLLHKHPDRIHRFETSYGSGHVFYPEASADRCTAALLLEVNPIDVIRGQGKKRQQAIEEYVNDRPYVCSSFLSAAISRAYGTAMSGRSKERQEVADQPLDLEATLSVVPCRGGPTILDRLFQPLGYEVDAVRHSLDPEFPDWGESPYYTVKLTGRQRLADLLTHLYVLIPVLDADKHYFVGPAEVQKLLDKGSDWLPAHPEKELISRRYFKNLRSLERMALARLVGDDNPDEDESKAVRTQAEDDLEEKINLNELRLRTVAECLKAHEATSVLDLGCGEGKLLRKLLKERTIARILGIDVSVRSLEKAAERLKFDRMPEKQRQRIELAQGSLMYRDQRFSDFDAIALVEVIEHVDLNRHDHLERVVFEHAAPRLVVVTTPNAEFNVRFETLPAGSMRHSDHRFEWTRDQFESWGRRVAEAHGYAVTFEPIGEFDVEVGAPTQMAVFQR